MNQNLWIKYMQYLMHQIHKAPFLFKYKELYKMADSFLDALFYF